MAYFVYILASKRNGTLYIGVTGELRQRVAQHREAVVPGFTAKHGVHHLVHYEEYAEVRDAIQREKNLKRWNRTWKLQLIEEHNAQWRDLFDQLNA